MSLFSPAPLLERPCWWHDEPDSKMARTDTG